MDQEYKKDNPYPEPEDLDLPEDGNMDDDQQEEQFEEPSEEGKVKALVDWLYGVFKNYGSNHILTNLEY